MFRRAVAVAAVWVNERNRLAAPSSYWQFLRAMSPRAARFPGPGVEIAVFARPASPALRRRWRDVIVDFLQLSGWSPKRFHFHAAAECGRTSDPRPSCHRRPVSPTRPQLALLYAHYISPVRTRFAYLSLLRSVPIVNFNLPLHNLQV